MFIGVLSGTSADSIDAGLFKIDKKISFLNFASTKYDEKLKDAILDISRNKKLPSKIEFIPLEDEGNKTVIEYNSWEFDQKIPSNYFTTQYVSRLK